MPKTMELGEYFGKAVRRRQTFGLAFTENRFPPRLVIPSHRHRLSHLTCILEGSFIEEYDDVQLECGPGSLLIVPQGLAHEDRMGQDGARTLSVELSPRMLARIGESISLFERPRVVAGAAITHAVERLSAEFRARDDASLLAIAAAVLEIVVLAERMTIAPSGAQRNWMADLVEELHRDPAEERSLTKLAARFGVGEAQMARAFRRRHGCSIGEYLRWHRLERAKRDLTGSASIAEIAAGQGFYDPAHFSRAFKNRYGITPSEFRRVQSVSFVQDDSPPFP